MARVSSGREYRREAAYRRVYPLVWWMTLLAPVVVGLGVLLVMWLTRGWPAVVGLVGLAVSSLLFGKFIILGGAKDSEVLLSAEGLAVMVVAMDVLTACWFVFHLGFMLRLPYIGPRLAALVADNEAWLRGSRWLRGTAFAGLVLFVMIPFAMTGAVGGAILARLLGLTRAATFGGVALGSVLGALAIYFGGKTLEGAFGQDHLLWRAGGLVILALVVLLVNWRFSRARRGNAVGVYPKPADSMGSACPSRTERLD